MWASIAAAYRAMDIDTTARAPGTPPRGPWQWQARSSAGASPSSAAASRGPQPPPPGLPPLSSASASSTNSSADMKDLSDRVHVVEHKLQKNPPEKLDDQIMCLDERIKTLENFDNIRIKMLETKLLEYEDRMKSLLEEEEKKNDKQIKFLTDMVDKMSEARPTPRTRPPWWPPKPTNALIKQELASFRHALEDHSILRARIVQSFFALRTRTASRILLIRGLTREFIWRYPKIVCVCVCLYVCVSV